MNIKDLCVGDVLIDVRSQKSYKVIFISQRNHVMIESEFDEYDSRLIITNVNDFILKTKDYQKVSVVIYVDDSGVIQCKKMYDTTKFDYQNAEILNIHSFVEFTEAETI